MQKINREVEFAVLMQLIEEKLSMDGEVNILVMGTISAVQDVPHSTIVA